MDSFNRIVLADPLCHDGEHVPFNFGFLEIAKHAFPDAKLYFLGEMSHLENIRRYAPSSVLEGVNVEAVKLPERHCRPFFERLRKESVLFEKVKALTKNDSVLVVFLSSPPTVIVNAWRNLPRDPRIQIHMVMHGGLSKLRKWRSRNPFSRVFEDRFLFSRLRCSNFRYIILERAIQVELRNIDPVLARQSMVVEHPLPLSPISSLRPSLSNPIKIGFLGSASLQKGFIEFCLFAKKMVAESPGLYQFHCIGGESKSIECTANLMSGLSTLPVAERIDRVEFVERLSEMDFVAMPYKLEHYSASPSGVLLDAIAYGKPVIATPYPAIENLFHRFGEFGIVAPFADWGHSLGEFANHGSQERYHCWLKTLKSVAESRSTSVLADAFREQVLQTK